MAPDHGRQGAKADAGGGLTVKAIVYRRYGGPDVLQCEQIDKPAPGDGEVLIKVRAAAINPLDKMYRGSSIIARLLLTGLRKPKDTRLGRDMAGEVEAVGKNVTRFKPGDAVFGVARGTFAEYVCASEMKLALKPDRATFEQAAAVPVAGLSALQGLRDKGKIQAGQKVLINGAAGGVGTFAVQIAKALAADVTAVCSTRNVEMVRSLGADRVIDYTREDFTRDTRRYDLILDCVGNRALSACKRVMTDKGILIMAGAPHKMWKIFGRMLLGIVMTWAGRRQFRMFMANINAADLATLREMIDAGKVTPVIDRTYTLSEVPDAIRLLETGHARGKIVIALEL